MPRKRRSALESPFGRESRKARGVATTSQAKAAAKALRGRAFGLRESEAGIIRQGLRRFLRIED